jgi:hypothetical protein
MRIKSWTIHGQFVPVDNGQLRWDQVYQQLVLSTQTTLANFEARKEEVLKDENCPICTGFDPTPGSNPDH